jgi:hypothetical protein
MKTFVIATSLVAFIWIAFIVSFQGLDLRKWSSWLYSVFGFLCGLALSTAISGNLIGSLKFGAIFGCMTLFVGVTMRRHNQETERTIRDLLQEYENEEHPSIIGRLVRKLFGKHE